MDEEWTPQMEAFWVFLRHRLGLPEELPAPPEPGGTVPLPLEEPVAASLRQLLGEDIVQTDPRVLARYGGGQTYEGYVRMLNATPEAYPRAVVSPGSEQALASLIVWAEERELSLLPWGSGLHPYRGKTITRPFLIVDMDRMDRIYPIDRARGEVRVQGGGRWIEIDRRLADRGLMLGYRHALANLSVGGRIASGGCNFLNLRYGTLQSVVSTVRMLTPRGPIYLGNVYETQRSLWSLAIGQYGRWGIITEVGLRVFPLPAERFFIRADFPDWGTMLSTAKMIAGTSIPLLFMLGWPTVLDAILRRTEERPPLARLRQRLGGGRETGQGITLWTAIEGEGECLALSRKLIAEMLQDGGGSNVTTLKVSPREHPIGERFLARVGQCRLCTRSLWRRGVAALTITHPAEWDNAAEALADWEGAMSSVLQSGGSGKALIATVFFARRSDVIFHSLLIGKQAEGGPAEWQRQLQMIHSVSESAVRRWQQGNYTSPLDRRLVAALAASLDPGSVMVR